MKKVLQALVIVLLSWGLYGCNNTESTKKDEHPINLVDHQNGSLYIDGISCSMGAGTIIQHLFDLGFKCTSCSDIVIQNGQICDLGFDPFARFDLDTTPEYSTDVLHKITNNILYDTIPYYINGRIGVLMEWYRSGQIKKVGFQDYYLFDRIAKDSADYFLANLDNYFTPTTAKLAEKKLDTIFHDKDYNKSGRWRYYFDTTSYYKLSYFPERGWINYDFQKRTDERYDVDVDELMKGYREVIEVEELAKRYGGGD